MIPTNRRADIISRPNGSTTVITPSEIKSPEELAYVLRYLVDYSVYKASKALGSTSPEAIAEAGAAMLVAAQSFQDDVAGPQGMNLGDLLEEEDEAEVPVSRLGENVVRNPYHWTRNA